MVFLPDQFKQNEKYLSLAWGYDKFLVFTSSG